MKHRLAFLLLVLLQAGCLHPLTSRLDRTNQQLEKVQGELEKANATLVEANARLNSIDHKIDQANVRLDRFLKRLGGVDADAPQTPAPAATPVPNP